MPDDDEQRREQRLQRLLRRLPDRVRHGVTWLRRPEARMVRIPAGILLMLGSVLAILPVFGLWMLPLGVVLLSDDFPALRRLTGRCLGWIERRHPNWLGDPLPDAPADQ